MDTILIVDDRPLNREYLVAVLKPQGHRLLEASDGKRALELAEQFRPQLVISDIMMPEMDGPQLVRELRANPALSAIPIIFYTATYLEREARTLAASCGVQHILMKPSPARLVRGMVNECLGQGAPGAAKDEPPAPPEATSGLADHQVVSQMAELLDLTERIYRERDPQSLLLRLCRGARYILGASFAAVIITDEEAPAFVSSGLGPDGRWGAGGFVKASALARQVIRERRPMRTTVASELAEVLGLTESVVSGESMLAAPIASSHQLHGILCLAGKIGHSAFTEHDERLAVALGTQLAVSYENVQLSGRLAASESRYRQLLENVPAGVFVAQIGEGWRTLYVNSEVERSLGYPASEWLQDSGLWRRLVHPEDRERVETALKVGLETGSPFREEYRLCAKGGTFVRFREDAAFSGRREDGTRLVHGVRFELSRG
ncbi:MAG: response regulator [Candidatus Wallbacteria bacterium]|nr:response regulator [Candidatus Wallbacteria bacterium]